VRPRGSFARATPEVAHYDVMRSRAQSCVVRLPQDFAALLETMAIGAGVKLGPDSRQVPTGLAWLRRLP
jgi:hypothetical protein